jgi:NAD+ synthetase
LIVTLHQINATVGDFTGNLDRIIAGAKEAERNGSSLAAFPELALTGYPPLDLLEIQDFSTGAVDALGRLLEASRDLSLTLSVGTILPRYASSEGKPHLNATVLIRGGQILATHAKVLLPTYDVFDESRHFHPGSSLTCVEVNGSRLALSICEDIWNDKTFWSTRRYHLDPVEDLFTHESMPLVNISASPYSRGKGKMRQEILASTARRYGVPVLYVNLVGGNDSLVFDGLSMVMGSSGQIVTMAKDFQEQVLTVDLDDLHGSLVCVPEIEDDMGTLFRALCTGLKDYTAKCGFNSAVLGLSGGIDSSVTAVIACEALGPENVTGILMPSPFTSPSSIDDAGILADNLGMKTRTIPISGIYEQYLTELMDGLDGLPGDTTEENIQARIRGNILMAFSNRFDHLVLSTGNKSELATGYCTLYGDMSGGLAVISDLYKGEVYELADHINRAVEIIPGRILTKPPSAELKPDQKDSDFLPPYDLLDPILKAYLNDKKTLHEIIEMGYPQETVRSILNMVEGSEYKRQQAPPGIKVSWKAFGIGRRCPIAKTNLF